MQTKSPDNSNIMHMFNNNNYIDFGAASKCVLDFGAASKCIEGRSYDIEVIKQNQNFAKPYCIKSDKGKSQLKRV